MKKGRNESASVYLKWSVYSIGLVPIFVQFGTHICTTYIGDICTHRPTYSHLYILGGVPDRLM